MCSLFRQWRTLLSAEVWLIDFATTRQDFGLIDLAKLLVSTLGECVPVRQGQRNRMQHVPARFSRR